jgi:hypothetical protein
VPLAEQQRRAERSRERVLGRDYPGRKPPFWLSSFRRAHTKAPYKTDLLWETLRLLKRPEKAHTEVARGLDRRDDLRAVRGRAARRARPLLGERLDDRGGVLQQRAHDLQQAQTLKSSSHHMGHPHSI